MNQIHKLPTWLIDKLKTELTPEKIINELRKVDKFGDGKFIARFDYQTPIFAGTYIDMKEALDNLKPNKKIVPSKLTLDYMDCLDLLELELKEDKK